ncbi:MAG TPA: hypothetical protein PKI11_11415 [Candidatus Hydrogenedentes bacterium]|nr:hypothetical protein [Candidatus Hydrogenedentota bacterium]HNT87929.1 hypothetical protein [Candidatus Hydrogenedentota bacterium]
MGSCRKARQVWTASRLRKWWLVHMMGYRVHGWAEEPRKTVIGGIRYVSHWRLGL